MADDKFEQALKGVKIPVLTLDNKWHRLFTKTDTEETGEMLALEEELNDLLKRQGKLNTELKDLRKLKANLMDEIVENMDGAGGSGDKAAKKKIDDSKRYIEEINDRIDSYQDELLDLPKAIDEVNYKLMLLTMQQCYEIIRDNTSEIDEIGDWIKNMRVELKRNILKKQKMEIKNVELYSYMHDIFGPAVVNIFDIKYDVEKKRQELLEKQAAAREERERAMQAGSNPDPGQG
ncbi:MAG: hypothetical protein K5985_05575 [Lachnospiraceae bacterium]|nr:hypothetical protein [Lachnospiraceae bacterium]